MMTIGHNVPGYTGETDPYETDEDPNRAVAEEINDVLTSLYETPFLIVTDTDEYVIPAHSDPVDTFARFEDDLAQQWRTTGECHAYLYETNREYDLGVHYWAVAKEVTT